MPRRIVLALTVLVALPSLSGRSMAATAHNSQAGAYGSTKNNCEPTPGCLSAAIYESVDCLPGPAYKRARYRPVPSQLGLPQ